MIRCRMVMMLYWRALAMTGWTIQGRKSKRHPGLQTHTSPFVPAHRRYTLPYLASQ